MGTSDKNPTVEDIIAAKLKAKAEEAAREAAEEARGGGGGRSGGIDFTGASGIHIGGSAAGRDQIGGNVTTTTTNMNTSGLSADDVAKLFDSLYKRIESKPKEDQPAIKEAVDTIKEAAQAEVTQGIKPDEKAVTAAAKSLAVDAPDLLTDAADVALATLANPAAGVIMLIRKIAEKAKASRAG
jgi:hypothetical protein